MRAASKSWSERRTLTSDGGNVKGHADFLLSDIGHECIDFISLFDEPGEDARCVCARDQHELGRPIRAPRRLTKTARICEEDASFRLGRHGELRMEMREMKREESNGQIFSLEFSPWAPNGPNTADKEFP